jgi:pantetheine-phosphate adenylyltransferase
MDAAIYPGSFDPITYGHLNIIERALSIFSRVVVLVAVNPQKSYLFSAEEKVEMIREATAGWPRIEVDHSEGLLVDYARSRQIHIAVRGLRAVTDFEGEFAMALTNRTLWPELDTVFLMTRSDYMYLSSSVVRQVAQLGGDISSFVPPAVERRLRAVFGRA